MKARCKLIVMTQTKLEDKVLDDAFSAFRNMCLSFAADNIPVNTIERLLVEIGPSRELPESITLWAYVIDDMLFIEASTPSGVKRSRGQSITTVSEASAQGLASMVFADVRADSRIAATRGGWKVPG